MLRVCFVCLGNIVRSPLAEHMFKQAAARRGVSEHYEVASGATGSWHVGEPPDPRMRRVAAARGLHYTGAACQIQAADLDRCDRLIAMDNENRQHLLRMARTPEQKAKIRLLREFDPYGGPNAGVPDPYYGGLNGFEEVYDIVERSVERLLDALEKERQAGAVKG